MLIHPFLQKEKLRVHQGTRLLQETLGLVGRALFDPLEKSRLWQIEALFAPIAGRTLGGVRAKLVDEKNFVTFINQMDLEVLLGLVKPGMKCHWSGRSYSGPGDRDWYGLCVDDDDLIDDLYGRELMLRSEYNYQMLPEGLEIYRRVHHEEKVDKEELHLLIGDYDRETGVCPDPRMETIENRWVRADSTRVIWEAIF